LHNSFAAKPPGHQGGNGMTSADSGRNRGCIEKYMVKNYEN